MRTLAAFLVVLASASAALACPRGARCATAVPQRAQIAASRHVAQAPSARPLAARPVALTVEKRRGAERTHWNLHELPTKSSGQMPRIWRTVRTKIEAKLPTYRGEGISFALSPVVVVSDAFDSAPCLGISGGF